MTRLSDIEFTTMYMLVAGFTYKEIAKVVSPSGRLHTAYQYSSRAKDKLRARTTFHAVYVFAQTYQGSLRWQQTITKLAESITLNTAISSRGTPGCDGGSTPSKPPSSTTS